MKGMASADAGRGASSDGFDDLGAMICRLCYLFGGLDVMFQATDSEMASN
jgi:hypothetical protein